MLTSLIIILVVFTLTAINSGVFGSSVTTETFEKNNQVEGFYYGENFKRITIKGTKSELKAKEFTVYQVVDGVTVKL